MFGRKIPGQPATQPTEPEAPVMASVQPVQPTPVMAQMQAAPLAAVIPQQPPALRMPEPRMPLMQALAQNAQPRNERRILEMNPRTHATVRPSSSSSEFSGERRLTVGRDITLTGEIASCDVLMVEGQIEATMKDSKLIEVTETGTFRGVAEVEQAKISGRYEGDLIVRGRLTVTDTGRIVGQVRYGELEVMPGGQLVGEMQMIQQTNTTSVAAPTPFRTSARPANQEQTDESSDKPEAIRVAS